jgi:multidrug efflux pump
VTISGIVALTLSPMMSSKLLTAEAEQHWLPAHINAGFERLKRFYGRLLDGALNARPAVYLVWGTLALLIVPMWMFSPEELAPSEDQGVIFGIVDAAANATLDQTSVFAAAANEAFMSVPETEFTFQITFPTSGFGGMVTQALGRARAHHLPDPARSARKAARHPRHRDVPGHAAGACRAAGSFRWSSSSPRPPRPRKILAIAQQVQGGPWRAACSPFPPLIDVKIDQPQTEIVIDRDKVAALGLNLQQVGADLGAAVGGNFVNRFNIAGRSYKVIPQVERVERLNPEQLQDLYVTGPAGQLVPLSTVATLRNSTEARSLNRFQQLNAVKISGVAVRPLAEALRFLEDEAAKLLPQGYAIDYTGESRQLRLEGGGQFFATMGLAIILIFLVLAAQFNSFRDPLIILLGSVPLAMFGALVFTFLKIPDPNTPFPLTEGWTTSLNIYSKVGLVTLVGLVAKNGILIVQFANRLQLDGRAKLDAVREAALIRLRPILMTTAATIAGHFPLVLVAGAGAAARNSIGLVLVGGIAIGTLFTLFVVPALYVLIAKDHAHDREAARAAARVALPAA